MRVYNTFSALDFIAWPICISTIEFDLVYVLDFEFGLKAQEPIETEAPLNAL
jgi:hypothetical protein